MIRPATLLLAGLVALACTSQFPGLAPGPERAPGVLAEREVDAIAAILRLEDHRTFDPESFQQFAANPTVEVRRRAVTAAGRIGDPAATPFLTHALARDPSTAVRADAAFALGLLGDTSAAVVRALRQAAPTDWIPVRQDETAMVVEILGALGRIGTDAARAEVVDVLRRVQRADDPLSRRVAAEALLAVWRFPAGAGRALSALRFVDHADPELRWRATLALVRLGDPEATPRMLPLLGDTDPHVRALAARALTAANADSAGIGDAAIEALTTALADPHPHVRINAARSLATFAGRAPGADIAALLTDPDANAAVAAVQALGALGPSVAPTLADLLGQDPVPLAVRAAALAQLARLHPDAADGPLAAWAAGDPAQRYAAARALAETEWTRAQPLLVPLAADDDPRVAIAATEALATHAAGDGIQEARIAQLRQLLLERTGVADPRQRTPALRGVAPLLRSEDLPAILDAYEAAVIDPDARPAAIAAVRAVAALRTRDEHAASAFFRRFQPPDDRWIRRAVADALGPDWGDPPPAAAAEDLQFYRELTRRYVVPALAEQRRPQAIIETPHGEIRAELLTDEAPLTVHNFMTLAAAGFYDQGVWHRVVPNFVLQDGAPAGDPTGGPGWSIRDEINRVRYGRGILGMALAGPDTGGSQWFITHSPQPHLDGGYTVFGRVVAGERAMDRVVQGDAVLTVRIRP